MKTKLFLFLILAVVILSGSCVGTTELGVFDESVPEAQRCNLKVTDNLSVAQFNNRPVNWSSAMSANKFTITLPPGKHTFVVTWQEAKQEGFATMYNTKRAEITHTFEPGKNYQIYQQNVNMLVAKITSVKIKEVK